MFSNHLTTLLGRAALCAGLLLPGLSFPAHLVGQAESRPTPVLAPETVEAIRREGFENSEVMRFLDELTNTIGHRLTGSDHFTRACHWAREQFAAMGLEAELEHWGTWPVTWDRGQWQGRVVEPEPLELQVATAAWTAGTPGRVRARLIPEPTDAEAFAAVEDLLPGAFVLREDEREGTLDALEELVDTRGIAGWVSSSNGSEQYPNRIRVFGRPIRDVERIPTTPDIVVRRDQAERLREMVESGSEVVVEFDIRNRMRPDPIDLHNVVAEIPGTEWPDEVVVVCGHLDSWHQATGTTDNGTGASTTLEAARILTAIGARPKRTIRFCLWGGEEQGLLGSTEHVKRRRPSMKDVQLVLNHDTGTNWAQSLTVNEAAVPLLRRVVEPLLAFDKPAGHATDDEVPVFELGARERIGGGGGSDHASFLAARVPAFSWGLRGSSDYFGYTWHSQWDTFDVAVPAYQRHTATVIAITALGAANLTERIPNDGIDPTRRGPLPLKAILGRRLGARFDGDGDLTVAAVREDGRAQELGLVAGDRIETLNGEKVANLGALSVRIRGIEAEAVKIGVRRDGEFVELDVPVAAMRRGRRR